jgi:hypothetical protein
MKMVKNLIDKLNSIKIDELTNEEDNTTDEEDPKYEEGDQLLIVDMHTPIELATYATILTKLAEDEHKRAKKNTFEEAIPKYLHEYKDVFDKEIFDELPPHRLVWSGPLRCMAIYSSHLYLQLKCKFI